MMQVAELILSSLAAHLFNTEFPSVTITDELFASYTKKAISQKILPMTASVILKSDISEQQQTILKTLLKQQVIAQTRKTQSFLAVYNELLKDGLYPLCVKGIICRSLYPEPDMRPSGDEDIVIDKANFIKCCNKLISLGFTADKDDFNCFEIGFISNKYNCRIELHSALFDTESNIFRNYNNLFDDIYTDYEIITYDNIPIYSLNKDKHLLYIILHAFKHFLYSGFGIRQLCDVIIFASSYSPDWNFIFSKCKKVKADVFLSAVLLIGQKYFNYSLDNISDKTELMTTEINAEPLLDDILSGSVYGADTEAKHHSATMTINSVEADMNEKKSSVFQSVFPSYSKMKNKYEYLNSYPYLLPVAWTKRIIDYTKKGNSSSEIIKTGNKRVELLRYYKIIK